MVPAGGVAVVVVTATVVVEAVEGAVVGAAMVVVVLGATVVLDAIVGSDTVAPPPEQAAQSTPAIANTTPGCHLHRGPVNLMLQTFEGSVPPRATLASGTSPGTGLRRRRLQARMVVSLCPLCRPGATP